MILYVHIWFEHTLPTPLLFFSRPAFIGLPDLESKCPPQQLNSSSHRMLFTAKTQSDDTQSAAIQLLNGRSDPRAKMGVAVYLQGKTTRKKMATQIGKIDIDPRK